MTWLKVDQATRLRHYLEAFQVHASRNRSQKCTEAIPDFDWCFPALPEIPETCDHGDFPDGTQGHDMLGDEIAGQFAGKHPDEPFTTYCDRALVHHHTM